MADSYKYYPNRKKDIGHKQTIHTYGRKDGKNLLGGTVPQI